MTNSHQNHEPNDGTKVDLTLKIGLPSVFNIPANEAFACYSLGAQRPDKAIINYFPKAAVPNGVLLHGGGSMTAGYMHAAKSTPSIPNIGTTAFGNSLIPDQNRDIYGMVNQDVQVYDQMRVASDSMYQDSQMTVKTFINGPSRKKRVLEFGYSSLHGSGNKPEMDLQMPAKKRCSNKNCGTTETPIWRKGPLGRSTLCNACGIKYRREEAKKAKETGNSNGNPTE